eukprot:TRINITY_DN15212_c1_g1_i1.p1 TRINITY_DN15212_c1_g1~~TRINITY_DN15212_c1_g1_i1.p1  ORF type:complete len:447 (+),score=60.66 TRINITY_DN15212_c1_g1_i1:51-1343(+)
MKLTMFIRTPSEVRDVTIEAGETVRCLHDKASRTFGMELERFLLKYEGTELDADSTEEIQNTSFVEGCEMLLEHKTEVVHMSLRELHTAQSHSELTSKLRKNPDLFLVLDVSGAQKGIDFTRIPSDVRQMKLIDREGSLKYLNTPGRRNALITVSFVLPNVTEIGDGFFSRCENLVFVDLTGMRKLTRIGTSFLSHCTALSEVDLSPLSNLTEIPDCFMKGCSTLESIDLAPFKNIATFGEEFLSDCETLREIDTTPMLDRRGIGCFSYLEIIMSVVCVIFRIFYSMVTFKTIYYKLTPGQDRKVIGRSFLHGCTSLSNANLAGLRNVRFIEDGFMARSVELQSVDLTPLDGTIVKKNMFFFASRVDPALCTWSGIDYRIGTVMLYSTPVWSSIGLGWVTGALAIPYLLFSWMTPVRGSFATGPSRFRTL